MNIRNIELWADSFHEGEWCCNNIAVIVKSQGGEHEVYYHKGFQPIHTFKFRNLTIILTVYGSYKSWKPIPKKISNLLKWGKPDFIAYDPTQNEILFAVEETAAVPTGNQALQRCERIYGSARKGIPFFYLLSEYGRHKDGGIRRDSIWPTIMSLKLTQTLKIPSIVLHYSDLENPENYSSGIGLNSLFMSLLKLLINQTLNKPLLDDMDEYLINHYENMLVFIKSQWKEIIDFIPGEELLETQIPELARLYALSASGENVYIPENFLVWPNRDEIPISASKKQKSRPLIKDDVLCRLMEQDIDRGKVYSLSTNAGSRPQPLDSVIQWIEKQRAMFGTSPELKPPAKFNINILQFPSSPTGNFHITTSKNIIYLYDKWSDLRDTIETAYPRLKDKLSREDEDDGVLVYVSNSMTPGRIFGDPYTGQISAFATIMGSLNRKPRKVVVYFPHQSHTQSLPFKTKSNKGIVLMRDLTDLIIFTSGVGISLKKNEVY